MQTMLHTHFPRHGMPGVQNGVHGVCSGASRLQHIEPFGTRLWVLVCS